MVDYCSYNQAEYQKHEPIDQKRQLIVELVEALFERILKREDLRLRHLVSKNAYQQSSTDEWHPTSIAISNGCCCCCDCFNGVAFRESIAPETSQERTRSIFARCHYLPFPISPSSYPERINIFPSNSNNNWCSLIAEKQKQNTRSLSRERRQHLARVTDTIVASQSYHST
jgi:hypothetical protein